MSGPPSTADNILATLQEKVKLLANVDTLWDLASLHSNGPMFLHQQQEELKLLLESYNKTLQHFERLPQKFPSSDKNLQLKVARKVKELSDLETTTTAVRKSISQLKEQVQVSSVVGSSQAVSRICPPEYLGHLAHKVGFELGSSNHDVFLFTATGALTITISYPPEGSSEELKVDVTLTMSVGSELRITKLEQEASDLKDSLVNYDEVRKLELEPKLHSLLRRCNMECDRVGKGRPEGFMQSTELKLGKAITSIVAQVPSGNILSGTRLVHGVYGVSVMFPEMLVARGSGQATFSRSGLKRRKIRANQFVQKAQMIYAEFKATGVEFDMESIHLRLDPPVCMPQNLVTPLTSPGSNNNLPSHSPNDMLYSMAYLCSWKSRQPVKDSDKLSDAVDALVDVIEHSEHSKQLYVLDGVEGASGWNADAVCSRALVLHCLSPSLAAMENESFITNILVTTRICWCFNSLIKSCIGQEIQTVSIANLSASQGEPWMVQVRLSLEDSFRLVCSVKGVEGTLTASVVDFTLRIAVTAQTGISAQALDATGSTDIVPVSELTSWIVNELSIPKIVHKVLGKLLHS